MYFYAGFGEDWAIVEQHNRVGSVRKGSKLGTPTGPVCSDSSLSLQTRMLLSLGYLEGTSQMRVLFSCLREEG